MIIVWEKYVGVEFAWGNYLGHICDTSDNRIVGELCGVEFVWESGIMWAWGRIYAWELCGVLQEYLGVGFELENCFRDLNAGN